MTKQEYLKLKKDVAKLYSKNGLSWREVQKLDRQVDIAWMNEGNLTTQEQTALRNTWR